MSMGMNDQASTAATLSAIRTLLSAGGGYLLVARGITTQETLQDVIGAIMVLGPLCWGVLSRLRSEAKSQVREHEALQAGVQAVRDDKLVGVPAVAIGPAHAQELIKEAKQENAA